MMIPNPENFRRLSDYPLTWTLAGLNILLFLIFFSGRDFNLKGQSLFRSDGLELTGRLYVQYLQNHKESVWPEWQERFNPRSVDHLEVLGAYALRDSIFLHNAALENFDGDEVAIREWRSEVLEFQKSYLSQVLFRFGLSREGSSPVAWITYQFSHAGLLHLLSNMVFLVFLGAAVEFAAGSLWLIVVYLLGGFGGGLLFLALNSHGLIPMVGASASISALLSFYWLFESRQRIRYFYFVAPLPGLSGSIYLPRFLILPLFLLSDFASLFSTPQGLASGIAYSAHVGGTLVGIALALIAKYALRMKPRWEFIIS